jgi:hypothetical protein
MKKPVEFQPPTGNLVLVVPRVDKSGDPAASTLFDDLALDLGNSSAINCTSVRYSSMYRWCSPRHQLVYRLTHGLTEDGQFLRVHPPVERCTDPGAVQPELDVILLVDHGILGRRESKAYRCGRGGIVP